MVQLLDDACHITLRKKIWCDDGCDDNWGDEHIDDKENDDDDDDNEDDDDYFGHGGDDDDKCNNDDDDDDHNIYHHQHNLHHRFTELMKCYYIEIHS